MLKNQFLIGLMISISMSMSLCFANQNTKQEEDDSKKTIESTRLTDDERRLELLLRIKEKQERIAIINAEIRAKQSLWLAEAQQTLEKADASSR